MSLAPVTPPGITPPPLKAYNLARAVLAQTSAYLADLGVDPPANAYVYAKGNMPVAICDTLVVTWISNYWGTAGTAEQNLPVVQLVGRVIEFSVWVFRCIHEVTGQGQQILEAYNPADEDTDAQVILTDAWALPKAIKLAHDAGLFGDYAQGMTIGRCQPIEAEGGVAGCVLDVTFEMS